MNNNVEVHFIGFLSSSAIEVFSRSPSPLHVDLLCLFLPFREVKFEFIFSPSFRSKCEVFFLVYISSHDLRSDLSALQQTDFKSLVALLAMSFFSGWLATTLFLRLVQTSSN
jgi:hypothetical protein